MTEIKTKIREYLSGTVPRALVMAMLVAYGVFGFVIIRSDSQQNERIVQAAEERAAVVDYNINLRAYERCERNIEVIDSVRTILLRMNEEGLVERGLIRRLLPEVSIEECGPEPQAPEIVEVDL